MKLNPEWKKIVKKAWSIRFLILAGIFSGFEVALPYLSESIDRGLFAALSGLAVGGAFITRLIAQKDFS